MEIYASILKVTGVLVMVVAGIGGCLAVANTRGSELAALAAAVGIAIIGLAVAASGEALEAFRDIARNSFHD